MAGRGGGGRLRSSPGRCVGAASAAAAAAAALLTCLLTCPTSAASADPAPPHQAAEADFMVSPDVPFAVPADFEVLDLTREAQRIPGQAARYLVLASRVVRPGHMYRLSVSVFGVDSPVMVRAALYRDSVRLSSVQRACTPLNMELIEIPVPANSGPGLYRLHTEGNEQDQLEGSLFRNRTNLRFEARSLTMLVQMDSPVYRQLQTVRFRVVLLGTDLRSFKSSADIFLLDPHGVVMKQWMSRQSNTGLVSAEYQLGERPVAGTWTVRVSARGQTEEQPFLVQLYQPPRFEVLVEAAPILRTSDFDLHVVVTANYTAGGGAASGQLTLLAEVSPIHRRPGWHAKQLVVEKLAKFDGRHECFVQTSRLRSLLQPLDGSEVKVIAQLVDAALHVTGQGHSVTRVFGDTIHLRFLGGVSQVFKPHMPFRAHLVAYMTDGSRLSPDRLIGHRLDVQPELVFRNGKRYQLSKRRAQMSSNHPGVWVVGVSLSEEPDFSQLADQVRYMLLSATLKDYLGKTAQAKAAVVARHTPSNLHLHLTTSTHFPKVGEFLVLHVRCNFHIESIRYLILSKGILLDHGLVKVEVPLHTFPVAVTAEMAPEATIMIYYLTWFGQIVTDTLRFPVSGLSRNNFSISVGLTNHANRPRYEVEVAVLGQRGSTVGLAAFQSSLYQTTSGTDVSSYKLVRAMQKFDDDGWADEFTHHWTTVQGRPGPTVHLASHRTALDLNQTFEESELLVVTDAAVAPPPPPPPCTAGGRLACRTDGCFAAASRCDGTPDCSDMSDEAACKDNAATAHSDEFLLRRRSRILSDFIPTWLWSDVTIGNSGHVILQSPGPNVTSSWVVSSIGVGEDSGLGYVHAVADYAVWRELETAAALPRSCVLGEQVGMVVTLLNRGRRPVTVNLVLAKSPHYRFVSQPELRSPTTTRRSESGPVEHRAAVSLPTGGSRSVTLPVQPLVTGPVIVTLYTEYHGVKDMLHKTIHVWLPGVPVEKHTALLADVSSRPNQYTFLDVVEPGRVVPGSYSVTVSLTGGVVGPWPDTDDAASSTETADGALCDLMSTLHQLSYLRLPRQRERLLMRRLSRTYQNLMAFRRDDGSFALYSAGQAASLWMTAHAARALAVLHASPRRQRSLLDTEVLASATRWLVGVQGKSGEFREQTVVADQRFNDTGDVMLTSQALLALTAVARVAEQSASDKDAHVQAKETLDVPGLQTAVTSAAHLLTARLQTQLSPLQVALAALALSDGGGQPAEQAHRLLSSLARDEGEFMYWSRQPHPLPAYRVQRVPYLQPRRTYRHESENVLATALALRTYLARGQRRTTPIVNWLQARRTSDFGWFGRMDSLAVTEALMEYWRAREDGNQIDIQMDVELADGRSSLHTHSEVAGIRHQLEAGEQPDGVKLRLTGAGLAVAQLSVQYRVESLRETGPFRLDVDAGHHSGDGTHLTLGLCVRWRDDTEAVSGSAVVLVDVPSGYMVSPAVLRQYVYSGLVPHLVSAQLTRRHQLSLVFSSLTAKPVCTRVTLVRWFAVTNISRSLSATAYQLHQPERRTTVMFDVSELSQFGLCDLCGSYQCASCSVTGGAARRHALTAVVAPPLVLLALLVCR